MTSGTGPENYPIEDALRAIDIFAMGKEGEPQLITFGDQIRHYAHIDAGNGERIKIAGEEVQLPDWTPLLVTEYGSIGEMAVDLKEKTAADSELFDERVQMLVEQGVLQELDFGPPPLPRTTAEELELEEFQSNCLSLAAIRQAAHQRAARQPESDESGFTIVNVATGESRTIMPNAAKLIAEGTLQVTRGLSGAFRTADAIVTTGIENGELLKSEMAELGLNADDVAVAGKDGELRTAGGIFEGSAATISDDYLSEDGEYTKASIEPSRTDPLPRHRLYYGGGKSRRVDNYDAGDFLDAAQATMLHHINFLKGTLRDTSGSDSLRLQPVEQLDVLFDRLRQGAADTGFDLGYSINTVLMPPEASFTLVKSDGQAKELLADFSSDEPRIGAANSLRAFERRGSRR